MKNKLLIFIALTVVAFFLASDWNLIEAQCPMCKLSAEQNLKSGGTAGQGLNTGILYMLFVPYLLVGSIAYWWWRNKRKEPVMRVSFTDDEATRYN